MRMFFSKSVVGSKGVSNSVWGRDTLKTSFAGAFRAAKRHRAASCLCPAWLWPVVLGMAFACAASAQTTQYVGTQSIVVGTLPGIGESLAAAVDGSSIIVAHSCIGSPPQCAMWQETPFAGGYTQTFLPDVGNDAGSFDWGANPPVVAVDSQGNIYTNDHYDCYPNGYGCYYETGVNAGIASKTYLWKLTPSAGSYTASIVTTLSNPGGARGAGGTIFGIAVDGSGNVYWTDANNGIVWKETLSGSVYTTSVIAGMGSPDGVAVDSSGNVYVADYGWTDNSTTPPTVYPPAVYKMTPTASSYTLTSIGRGWVSPSGVSSWVYPEGVTVDSSGNVYVADPGFGMSGIFKLTPAAGSYTVSMIPVQGESALYYGADNGNVNASDLAVDSSGSLYIAAIDPASADSADEHLLKETSGGGNFGAVNVGSQSLTPLSAVFLRVGGGGGNIPVFGSWTVRTQGAQGMDFTDAGTGSCAVDSGAAEVCTVNVNFTPTRPGARYGAVEVLDNSGNLMATGYFQGTGLGPQVNFLPGVQSTIGSGFSHPEGVAVDGSGNVFVADSSNSAVKEIVAAGGYATVDTLGSGFLYPAGAAVDGRGNIFVADTNNSAVKEIVATGGYATVDTLGSGFRDPYGVAVDGSGNVFVADTGNSAVKEIVAAGGYTTINTLGSGFSYPEGVAVDGNGNVFVADTSNSEVKEIVAAGGYTTVNTLGSGFSSPDGVAVDSNGNVFVADYGNDAVKEILAAGGYATVNTLGSGFNQPTGVTLDGSGNVYVADWGNNRVEKLDYADPPSLTFAYTPVGSTSSDSPQTVEAINIGNQPLIFAGLSYPTDFPNAGGANPCTSATSLSAGQECDLPVQFTPQNHGVLSENLTLTDNNLNGTNVKQSISLRGTTLAPQTITFTTIAAMTYGDAPFGLSATASSGLAVSFASATTSVCTVSNTTVTLVAAGNCTVWATQAGNTDYAEARAVSQTFAVHGESQTITFPAIPATTLVTGTVSLNATATSGLAVSYSSTTTPVCTVSSSTVALVAVGTCSIEAKQSGNTGWDPAPSVTQSFKVTIATPAITWTVPAAITYGTALSGTQLDASSTVAGSFAYTPASGTVLAAGAQTLSVTFTPSSTTDYTTVTKTVSLTVNKAPQTITFEPLSAETYGDAPFGLSAMASSGLAVSFASTTTAVCTVSDTTVTLVAAGNCTIRASQAGNTDYLVATNVYQTFSVHGEPQTITFPAIANTPLVTGTITLDATASSGLPVSYTSTTTTVCTVSASTVTLVAVGPCSIEAKQAGTTGWDPAAPVTRSFRVLASQTITFPTIPAMTYGVAPFSLSATASSGLAVSFASASKSVCTVSGTTATLVAAGNCILWATQAGNTEYAEATAVSQTFAVHGEAQTIAFPAIPATTLATGTVALDANASSGLAVSYTSTTTSICTVSGNTASLVAVGTCSIEAKQAGDTGWDPAPPVTQSFKVTAD